MAVNPQSITACKECGSTGLSWQASIVNRSCVQQGRLNTNDVECLFVLCCDRCYETLSTISADKVASLIATKSPGEIMEMPMPSECRDNAVMLPRSTKLRENPLGRATYDPNKFLDRLLLELHVKNDAALCRALEIAPPLISKLRHRVNGVSPSILLRIHDVTGIKIDVLREWAGI